MKKQVLLTVLLFSFVCVINAQDKKELKPVKMKANVGKTVSGTQVVSAKTQSVKSTQSTTTVATYDFTTGSDKYYGGTDAAVEVESGVWAMIAGDANGDGNITTSDYNLWLPQNNTAATGYLPTDMNLDGNVTTSDYNVWLPNNNAARSTQVP